MDFAGTFWSGTLRNVGRPDEKEESVGEFYGLEDEYGLEFRYPVYLIYSMIMCGDGPS